jgi:hypothetical protein
VSNAVIAPISTSGTVCFFSLAVTDIVVDINGWFSTGAGFSAVDPERLFDTRPGTTGLRQVPKDKVGGADVFVLEVRAADLFGSVPATGVSAVSINVAVTASEGDGFVTAYPCTSRREVATINYRRGQTVSNAAIVPLSPTGSMCFYSYSPVHIIADINGWFATGAGFTAVDPERVVDTRPGTGGLRNVAKARVGGGYILEVQMSDLVGLVPATGVGAVSLNVAVTAPDSDGFVTVYPCGSRREVASVNYVRGQTVSNAVIAPVSTAGTVCFFSLAATDIVVDINGWFST